MPELFDENALRAEIAKVWGEHGAHIDVFDHVLKEARKAGEIRKLFHTPSNVSAEGMLADADEILG